MATRMNSDYIRRWLNASLLLIAVTAMRVAGECLRWNCPCNGLHPRRHDHVSVPVKRYQQMHAETFLTNKKLDDILSRMVTDRFRGNTLHVQNLKQCAESRSEGCLVKYLENQCRMNHLPNRGHIEKKYLDLKSDDEFMRFTQEALATIASYVEQARNDEERLTSMTNRSLANDIRTIEEEGIYYILCSLEIKAASRGIPWSLIERELMEPACLSFTRQATTDNRNYMTFYALSHLLHTLERHFKILAVKEAADN